MKKHCLVDMQAARFPIAQIQLNAILDKFVESEYETMSIVSVNDSLGRCINQRISHRGLKLTLSTDVKRESITNKDIERWQNDYDEEDYEDVLYRLHFKIIKNAIN